MPSIARTPESAISKARASVHTLHAERLTATIPNDERAKRRDELPVWSLQEAVSRHGQVVLHRGIKRRRVLVLVDGCLCDVGGYLEDHVSTLCEVVYGTRLGSRGERVGDHDGARTDK